MGLTSSPHSHPCFSFLPIQYHMINHLSIYNLFFYLSAVFAKNNPLIVLPGDCFVILYFFGGHYLHQRFRGHQNTKCSAQCPRSRTKRNSVDSAGSIILSYRFAAVGRDVKCGGAPACYSHLHLLVCGIVYGDSVGSIGRPYIPASSVSRNCRITNGVTC